jgi:uncharacterized membrane protein
MMRGVGIGAALMYFFDPRRGARRRAMLKDKLTRVAHLAGDSAGIGGRDLANRARGLAAEVVSRVSAPPTADETIADRVHSALGRFVSHPGAIRVTVEEGRVTLDGDVLESEAPEVVARVPEIRGVRDVLNRLRVHQSAEGVPALQGNPSRGGEAAGDDGRVEAWTPAGRLLSSVAGGALALLGARRRGGLGTALGLTGLALLARGTTNRGLRRAIAGDGIARPVDVQKTITIAAPREMVYAFVTEWERFPEWMTHVREVRSVGPRGEVGERTHWVVDGPAGTTVAWNAETTGLIPGEFVSWRSVEGSTVRQAGSIRFAPVDEDTRVHVQPSYVPPGGALGHAVARLLGRDPRQQMNDDLARLKTTIETGTPPRDAARSLGVRAGPDAGAPADATGAA